MGIELRRVRRAADKMTAARDERDAAIMLAYRAGETYRAIADAAHLSHQRVAQIVRASGQPPGS